MDKRNLELLGLPESASWEDVENAYKKLRAQLSEDRFLDGEAGNAAARRLTQIGVAYEELKAEYAEQLASEGNEFSKDSSSGSAYARVEQKLKEGDLQEAQRLLDEFNERGAQWHYLQSIVFYRKNWVNESKKQLEIAMRLDGENQQYKEAYRKLNEKVAYDERQQKTPPEGGSVYRGQDMNYADDNQMGGSFCSYCAECCAINACLNCICNGCCCR